MKVLFASQKYVKVFLGMSKCQKKCQMSKPFPIPRIVSASKNVSHQPRLNGDVSKSGYLHLEYTDELRFDR